MRLLPTCLRVQIAMSAEANEFSPEAPHDGSPPVSRCDKKVATAAPSAARLQSEV